MSAKYLSARDYCRETGFPVRAMMEKLVHSEIAEDCFFRTTKGKTAPYYINVNRFEQRLNRGDFKEVLEA